jgi:hypothetical protein
MNKDKYCAQTFTYDNVGHVCLVSFYQEDLTTTEIDNYLDQVFKALIHFNDIEDEEAYVIGIAILPSQENVHIHLMRRSWMVDIDNLYEEAATIMTHALTEETRFIIMGFFDIDKPLEYYGSVEIDDKTKYVLNRYILKFGNIPEECENTTITHSIITRSNPKKNNKSS